MSSEKNPGPSHWTIRSIMDWSFNYLKTQNVTQSARLDVEVLMAHVLKQNRIYLYTHFDKPLVEAETKLFGELLRRRAKFEPVAYLTGVKEFMGMEFIVDHHVLIPRPDTEVLVETILGLLGGENSRLILDVGAGSGCIALSLAKHLPNKDVKIESWDISQEALVIANKNAKKHNLDSRVIFQKKDALDPQSWPYNNIIESDKFDLIVSNPPYIPTAEFDLVCKETSDFEPKQALYPGVDDLIFYRTLVKQAQAGALKQGGHLCVEIGFSQANAVVDLFEQAGFCEVEVKKDYANHARVVKGQKKWNVNI